MFCPRCSTESGPAQSYCRQCGLTLSTVRLAMEGRVDEALTKLKKGKSALRKGFIIFTFFLLAAIVSLLRSGPFEIAIWPLTFQITHWWVAVICSLLLGIPVILVGLSRLRRAERLLDAHAEGSRRAVEEVDRTEALPPAAPGSVIEDRTQKLDERMPRRSRV